MVIRTEITITYWVYAYNLVKHPLNCRPEDRNLSIEVTVMSQAYETLAHNRYSLKFVR